MLNLIFAICVLRLQDAYMPKDASKLGHRGIGFVTFASPDSVEKVLLSLIAAAESPWDAWQNHTAPGFDYMG